MSILCIWKQTIQVKLHLENKNICLQIFSTNFITYKHHNILRETGAVSSILFSSGSLSM